MTTRGGGYLIRSDTLGRVYVREKRLFGGRHRYGLVPDPADATVFVSVHKAAWHRGRVSNVINRGFDLVKASEA